MSAAEGSPLAQPLDVGGFIVGNRWCVHPMEGWDGTIGGEPTEHTIRRWKHFGESGCKLIWGGEAFAVEADGRANPNQLALMGDDTDRAVASLDQLLPHCAAPIANVLAAPTICSSACNSRTAVDSAGRATSHAWNPGLRITIRSSIRSSAFAPTMTAS